MPAAQNPAVLQTDWLTCEEVMQTLGRSRRTVQEWAQNGFLNWRERRLPGRSRPERVYAAADVQKLKENNGPPRPPPKPREPTTAVATRPRGELITLETARELAKLLAPVQGVSVTQKLWLTIEEGMMYSQFGKSYLMRLIRDKKIVADKAGAGGRWLIQRASLEAFGG